MSVQFNTSQNPHHQYYILGDELVSVVKSRCLRGQEFKFRALLKKVYYLFMVLRTGNRRKVVIVLPYAVIA